MCNMIISLGFFSYLKILDFRGCQGVKGQKIAQNEKKILYPSCAISGTVQHMIMSFVTHFDFSGR